MIGRPVMALLAAIAWASAAAQAPEDFAYGLTVELQQGGALQAVELPAQVYRYATREDLGDLRLFDAAGRVLPHLIENRPELEREPQLHRLQLYPLTEAELRNPGELRLRIEQAPDRRVIELHQRSGDPAEDPAIAVRVSAYLLVAERDAPALDRLRLQWQGGRGVSLFRVRVQASDDLDRWRTLAREATLAELEFEGNRLLQNEIEIPPTRARYFRLLWPPQAGQVLLSAASGEAAGGEAVLPLRWLPVPGLERAADGAYRFDLEGQFRVERLRIALQGENPLAPLRVESRAGAGEAWRLRAEDLVYDLQVAGSRFRRDQLRVGGSADRHWRISADAAAAPLQGVEIGWRAQRLVFVASGPGPYVLAFGAAGAEPLGGRLDRLLLQLKEGGLGAEAVSSARVGPHYELGGPGRLQPGFGQWPWRRILLWGLLLAGVAVLALMARSLLRELR